MISQHIEIQPILDLCEEIVWRTGTWVAKRWKDQEELDLEGARAVAAAADKEGPEEAEGEVEGVEGN